MLKAFPFVLAGALIGAAAGLGGYTFVYAKGASYLTNDPKACANCHVMQDYYDAWQKGSHHAVAACNDCHTPHTLVPKYAIKASNGFWHSFAFTTGRFHQPIQIKPRNHRVTESACRYCHQEIVEAIEPDGTHSASDAKNAGILSCTRCHANVGHMR